MAFSPASKACCWSIGIVFLLHYYLAEFLLHFQGGISLLSFSNARTFFVYLPSD